MTLERFDHPGRFYLLSTIIPWAFWFAAGYVSHLLPFTEEKLRLVSLLGFIGLLGPAATAYWLIGKDPEMRSDLWGRLTSIRSVRPVYLFIACFLMLASILLAQGISLLFGYSASQFVITGHFTFSSGVFPVWFMLIVAPILEELGWHSYGTDCLRNRMNLLSTSLLFGLFWGIWHMPLSTIRGYYQSNLVQTGWIYGANFLVSIVPYVLLMNWLYYKTGRNILIAVIFHITAGYFNEIFATDPDSKIVQTVLLLILATYLVASEREFFFRRGLTNGKPVAPNNIQRTS
ncbi:MAG TPA: CPBP family intramembrane glutamic endopeptidase [Bacteroidota bacterium]|nr:CPBP family intramembrane glutamic endopeptidase [Bacteroidota bacterium]